MARILALDAALSCCSAALAEDGRILAEHSEALTQGHATILPLLTARVLESAPGFDTVAVTTGPGRFTGLRAALALAHGLAMGANVPLVGGTVAESVRQAVAPIPCWVAVCVAGDYILLDRAGVCERFAWDSLPEPWSDTVLAGEAAAVLRDHYAALGWRLAIREDYQPLARYAALAAPGWMGREAPIEPLYGQEARIHESRLRPTPSG